MLHVLKRSCNAHVMLFFSHFTVCAYQKSRNSFANKTLEIYFKKKNNLRDGINRLVMTIRSFTTLKSVAMLKIIEFFFYLCIPHFVVECT